MSTINSHLLPASTGLGLGNQNQSWTGYLRHLFLCDDNGTITGTVDAGAQTADLGSVTAKEVTIDADANPTLTLEEQSTAKWSISNGTSDTLTVSDSSSTAILTLNQNGGATVKGQLAADQLSVSGGNATLSTLHVTGSTTIDGNLLVQGTLTPTTGLTTSSIQSSGDLDISAGRSGGSLVPGGDVVVTSGHGLVTGSGDPGDIVLNGGNKYFASSVVGHGQISTNTTFNKYNDIDTVADGLASQVAIVDLVGQTGTVSTTPLYTPSGNGFYRVLAYLKITATGTSPVIGPVVISFTDATDSVAQNFTMALAKETGAIATTHNGNATDSILCGQLVIWAKKDAAISYGIGTSGTFGTATYEAHFRLERLG